MSAHLVPQFQVNFESHFRFWILFYIMKNTIGENGNALVNKEGEHEFIYKVFWWDFATESSHKKNSCVKLIPTVSEIYVLHWLSI